MVKVKEDLTGKTFGRLYVIKQMEDCLEKHGRQRDQWLCKCECGNFTVVIGKNLKKKNGTQSCGCLGVERLIQRNTKENIYDLNEQYGVGYTSNTNEKFYFSLQDYNLIESYCWHEIITKTGYRVLKAWDVEKQKEITMAELLGCKNYDHANRNTLDNRRENLRPATSTNNSQNRTRQRNNTSGFTGVCWNKKEQMWVARIGLNGKNKNLGCFTDKTEAIRCRLLAEAKYYGEFAPQRHLFEQYEILT